MNNLTNTQAPNDKFNISDAEFEKYYFDNKLYFDGLWVKMAEVYPNWWIHYYGKRPSHTWLKIFKNLSREQINFGLKELSKQGSKYLSNPPMPLEFRDLCLQKRELNAIELDENQKRFKEIEDNFNRAHEKRMMEYQKIMNERCNNVTKGFYHGNDKIREAA